MATLVQEIQPAAIHVHCLAHSLNLDLQDTVHICLFFRHALHLMMELNQLIKWSLKMSSFLQGLSETIKRILELLHIWVVLRPQQTIRKLVVRPKDPVPSQSCSSVVYCISCSDIDCFYVRIWPISGLKEHMKAMMAWDLDTPTLAEHTALTGYRIDWGNATVLDSSSHYHKRLSLESWYSTSVGKSIHLTENQGSFR